MPPAYPPKVLGNSVISELKIAYCTAVNCTLVRLDKNATKAALAKPAAKLSALTTAYISDKSWPAMAKATKAKLVRADRIAPHIKVRITP